MKRAAKPILLVAAAAFSALAPCCARACGGPAGNTIAITGDGTKYTVTNVGRQLVTVIFTAWGKTYQLVLAPGQSGTPISPGPFGQFMRGYQSCTTVPQGR